LEYRTPEVLIGQRYDGCKVHTHVASGRLCDLVISIFIRRTSGRWVASYM
jgi:hypothetical protein